MPKDAYIKFRCSEAFKRMVEERASDYGKNVTDYMEYLIRKDTDNMNVIMNDVSEDCFNELKEADSCYLSTDENWWLFSDMNFLNYVSHKYGFDKPKEEYKNPQVETYSLEDYCSIKYDCEEFEYFGMYYSLLEMSYSALNMFDEGIKQGNIDLNKWDRVIDNDIKTAIMIRVADELGTQFKKLVKEGYDVGIVEMEIKRIMEDK